MEHVFVLLTMLGVVAVSFGIAFLIEEVREVSKWLNEDK